MADYSKYTDQQLVGACLKGKRQAQFALYTRHVDMMKGVCLRYAGNEMEAEDILQDAFVHAFQKLDKYAGKGTLGGWLRRLTVNKALEHYRKNKSIARTLEGARLEMTDTEASDAKIFGEMKAADLMKKIQQLPNGCRTVFNLYAIEGYTHVEIADLIGIAVGTSKSQFSHARKLLIEMIRTEDSNEQKRMAYAKG